MAAQRIVVTSPWKLGLFVFLLVVGTGFGLIYTWLRLFGGVLELDNQLWLNNFYMVCGAIAGLGLTGYLAVVASARPLDGVMRGGRNREKLLKGIAKVKNPADVDIDAYKAVPALANVLERWRDDAETAGHARTTLEAQRKAIKQLAERVRQLGVEDSLTAREEDQGFAPLVNSINACVEQIRTAAAESPTAADGRNAGASQDAWNGSLPELRQHQQRLDSFARAIQEASMQLSQGAGTAADDGGLGGQAGAERASELSGRSVERLRELRQKLEGLAEESSRLAIQAALQVSRLGEAGSGLVDVTEEIRSVSTRYQRLVPDLRLCESDAEMIAAEAANPTAAGGEVGGAAGTRRIAMTMSENALGIREIARAIASMLQRLSGTPGAAEGPAPTEMPAPSPVIEQAPVAPPVVEPTPVAKAAPVASPVVEPTPVVQEEIFEMAALGGHELDAEGRPIYDLMEFDAAEV